jgi:hypothetical protein
VASDCALHLGEHNLQRARANYDLVKLEIDRLENKIRSLSELAVNRQEPDDISGQVDQVAASMMETETKMNKLPFVAGLDSVDAAPSLLQNEISPPASVWPSLTFRVRCFGSCHQDLPCGAPNPKRLV